MTTRITTKSRATSARMFFGALLLALGLSAAPAQAQTWMVSTTPYIKLGVLDKYSSLGEYTATFVVVSEKNSQEYILVKQVLKGQNGVDVLFPTEPSDPDYFKNAAGLAVQPAPGRYTWECRVKGKRVVGGHFDYPDAGNDITVVGAK